jgi:hypothetical protein
MKASFRDIRTEYKEYRAITEWEKREFDPEINQEKSDSKKRLRKPYEILCLKMIELWQL